MIPVDIVCWNCGGFTGEHKMMKDPTPDDTPIGRHPSYTECIAYLRRRIEDIETGLKVASPQFIPNRPPLPSEVETGK